MIKEELWNIEKKQFEIPKFSCPTCNTGIVISNKNCTIENMTNASNKLFDITMNENDYLGYFSSISKCNNPACNEVTSISGETKLHYSKEKDHINRTENNFEFQGCKKIYIVKYTNPAINLINLPKNTPSELTSIITESFQLFWIDEASCANKIRSGIEKLLDLQKVRKTRDKNGKRLKLNLHTRIEKFKENEPRLAEHILALKWIGNQGSHHSKGLNKHELNGAYKILEICLIDLYDTKRNDVNSLTKKINKQKMHKIKTTSQKD